jgi:hypothetical protein
VANPIDDGGCAFPAEQHETQDGRWNQTFDPGMTLRDYAAIRFAAAWVAAISGRPHSEPDSAVAVEANRLGLLQADAFIQQRRARHG